MPHDIIDNRDEKLVEHIKSILGSTDSARFAVGYFFLSGLEAIQDKLAGVKTLRLLIGNTTNRETIEQISEGYKRLDLVEASEEREQFIKKAEQKRRSEETAGNLRKTVEVMDQTDDGEALVKTLIQLIEEKRLEVKVYTKGRLHAKAYIFDYGEGNYENGIAVVGSSNLTLSGLTHNTELNVVVHGNENHAQLGRWFDELWDDAQDFEAHLMEELKQSWAASLATPYDIYMKTLYALVADRLEEGEDKELLWDDEITRSLADFQKVAVKQAIQMIRDHGGAFVSDVVGLGKSYIGAGIVKHFERTQGARPLIICPKPLEDMWEDYNETFQLNARVLPMSQLRSGSGGEVTSILDQTRYKDRDFVLIDESHHFRHHSSQRYELLHDYLAKGGKKVCLLTATPRNKSAKDVYNQIKLFHQDDITHLPIDPPNLKDYFKQIEGGGKRLQDLLVHLLIRRTRRHILRYYGYTEDTHKPMRELSEAKAKSYLNGSKRAYVMVAGDHQFFPARELETLRYSIEDTYAKGLYAKIRAYLGRPTGKTYTPKPGVELTYARYGLWHYVKPSMQDKGAYKELHRAGINLRGLIRVMLFKRFESSVQAFRVSLERIAHIHEMFLKALDQGFVPAGDEAQGLLYQSDRLEESELMDALSAVAQKYDLADFDEPKLREHLEADREVLEELIKLVEPISPAKDAKLQRLIDGLKNGIPKATGKVLIFTQYADTAAYLYKNLNPDGQYRDIESIYGTDKSKARMAARFSPKSNPHVDFGSDSELRILVTTDVMSEGLNLQDGDVLVNYDLHWNPVRLIQRFGRIDRIGGENDAIYGFNFLPETEMEKQLGLQQLLSARIAEIHETIGEDSAILDKDEQVNEEAMFCIYEQKSDQLSFFEDEEGDFVDINEAEEMLRSLQADDPEEFERISNLRDGIRSGRASFAGGGRFVFCQSGKYQQLFLLDEDGKIVSQEVRKVLARLKCSKSEPAASLSAGHNQEVMRVLQRFADEARQRTAQQKFSMSLTVGQSYALRELRAFHSSLDPDEFADLRSQIGLLEESFKQPLTAAIKKQLNSLRRNGITGNELVRLLSDLYHDHGMKDRDFQLRYRAEQEGDDLPRIICSEAFV
ncbi:phospholipase D-like domain-containing protein [Akkermansiaceae bacterium]|nr:phospholipase D-like domain-containing protein [Akkermansiaceae bacterium]